MGRSPEVDEVRDMRDQIVREMREGFKGVHKRQDIANGRVGKLEELSGRLDERLEFVERESEASHTHRRVTDQPPPPPPPKVEKDDVSNDRRLTEREVWLVSLGAGSAFGLIKVLPWLVSLAQAGKP